MKKSLLVLVALFLSHLTFAQSPDDLINRYFEVIGGRALQENCNSMVIKGDMNVQGQDLAFTRTYKRPNKQRIQIDVMGMTIIPSAYNGTYAWTLNPMAGEAKPQKLSPEQTTEVAEGADFDMEIFNYKDKGYTATMDEPVTIDGKPMDGIKLVKNIEGQEPKTLYFYFDKETGYMRRMVQFIRTGPAKGAKMAFDYNDYKDIGNGMKYAYTLSMENPGQGAVDIKITDVQYNPVVEDMIFDIESAQ